LRGTTEPLGGTISLGSPNVHLADALVGRPSTSHSSAIAAISLASIDITTMLAERAARLHAHALTRVEGGAARGRRCDG
jgi:hypothetical protein